MQFTDWAVQDRTVYQLRFGPYTILAWTAQSVNCHIALKAMFYLLNKMYANKNKTYHIDKQSRVFIIQTLANLFLLTAHVLINDHTLGCTVSITY